MENKVEPKPAFGELVPLKNSEHVASLLTKIDAWKADKFNRQLISPNDDYPQLAFADSRSDDPVEFNKQLGTIFKYEGLGYEITSRDFVVLGDDGDVIGYFHCLISEISGGITSVTGLRTYRFGGTPYRYGKAQRAFYDWLYETFDIVSMLFVADGDFTKGKVSIENKDDLSPTLQRVFKQRQEMTGFAQPGAFKNILAKYRGIFQPYVHFCYDLDGGPHFLHIMRWRGKRGIEKGLPDFENDGPRPEYVKNKMREFGITNYL